MSITWLNIQTKNFGDAIAAHAFTSYISEDYMPSQRRKNNIWPQDLSGLDKMAQEEKVVLDIHRDHFKGIEIISTTNRSITYRLRLGSYTAICTSTVNPDGGSCKY